MSAAPAVPGFSCHVCGFPVAPLDGMAYVRRDEINEARRARQSYRENTAGKTLIAAADVAGTIFTSAPWRIVHTACLDDDVTHYWIGLAEMERLDQVIWRMCHLGEKGWPAEETNWIEFIRRTYIPDRPSSDG